MTPNDDPIIDTLRSLPALSPDPARASGTRAKCHKRMPRRAKRKRIAMRVLDGAAAAALCAYLAAVFQIAFRLAIGGSPVLP